MNAIKITSGLVLVLALIIGSVIFKMQLNHNPEALSSNNPEQSSNKDTLNQPRSVNSHLFNKLNEYTATSASQSSQDTISPTLNSSEKQLQTDGPTEASVKGFPFAGNQPIERSSAQMEKLGKELELWETMMSSEYGSYSKETLIALANQGDPVAFHQLIVNGDASVDDIQRLAKQLAQQGYPMVYGFAADGIFGSTKDKILAMAYYMAAVNHGSELMRQFELDYQVWFKLEEEELALAAELAEEL